MDFLELADYVAAGVALAIGIGIGRAMRVKPPKPLTAVCTCEHGFGQHEDGHRCHGQVQRSRWDKHGLHSGYDWVDCSCLRYDGPSLSFLGHVDLT